ncbi:MAG: transcriptional repressor [Candidatus Lokiarchaeota archaeon]|nr:transcriptional repressor [Candidatus Lokiarchaeota archaeon]
MNDQQIMDLFHEKGLKITTQRRLISKYILSRTDHPTAEQVYSALEKEYPAISLATVYKTLNLLYKLGIIQELGFGEGPVRYDPNTAVHINMVCTKCGSIIDYRAKDVETWWNELIEKLDAQPVGQRIDIYYLCEKCKKK